MNRPVILAGLLGSLFTLSGPVGLYAVAPSVSLGGPEITRLDWNIRALTAADLDGDGRTDLAVIDNDRATIELLYQIKPGAPPDPAKPARANRWEPVVDDARFRRVSVTTGVTMIDLAIADLNHDGRPDLIYTGDTQALAIRYQQADGTWLEKKIPEAPAAARSLGTLACADFNRDGKLALVMLGLREIAIFYPQADGQLAPPVRLPLADENCYGLEVLDANGDGLPDIVYLANGSRDILRVRLQNAAHQFGPELAYPIKPARSTLQVLSAGVQNGPPTFVFAANPTGQLEFFTLAKVDESTPGFAPRPRVFTPSAAVKNAAYAFGDFDGDGREDIAMSDPDGAQVFIYFRQADGGFTAPRTFPSLVDARSLAAGDWEGNGRASLFIASPKEQILGVATVNADGRLGYPQPLPVAGRPLAVAAGDLEGKGRTSIVVLTEDKGARAMTILQRQGDGSAKIVRRIDLPGLKTDPHGLKLVDANQDGRLDLAVFTPLDAMRLFIQQPNGSFTDGSVQPAYHKSLVDDLEASALSVGDLAGDGRPLMLVSTGAFARALRLDAHGALTTVDQFNARDTTAEITAALVLPAATRGARPDVLLYDRKGEQFQRLHAGQDGVYNIAEVSPAGKIDVVGAEMRLPSRGGTPEMFLLGKSRFWWLPPGRSDLAVRPVETYATDLPGVDYSDVTAGSLTGDGSLQLVAVDPQENMVEILARDPQTRAWTSQLHFKVFESDQHYQGKKG